jgi:hypothetical protein
MIDNRYARFLHRIIVPVTMLAAGGLVSGCSKPEFQSQWQAGTVVIDGRNREWTGILHSVDRDRAEVGVMNNGEYLTVALITGDDEMKRVILRQGVTVWFDPSGGTETTFGVHYPLGTGFRGERGMNMDRPIPVADELEICGPAKDQRHRMTVAQAGGIAAKFQVEYDTLVFEMRVPLREDGTHPFAINAKPGSLIGVGIEATAPVRGADAPSSRGRGEEGGMGGGGMGGGRSGRGGRGGSSGGAQETPRSAAVDLWAKVHLALEDSTGVVK